MQYNKPLTECRTEAERREYYPQLCHIADMIEGVPDPAKAIKAILFIIAQRRRERGAGANGKE